MISVYIENTNFWNHIVFSFTTIFNSLGIRYYSFKPYVGDSIIDENDVILYAKGAPRDFKGIFIETGVLFTDIYLRPDSIPASPLKRIQNIPVVYCGVSGDNPRIISDGPDVVIYNWDIVQSSFFFVTGYEEVVHSGESRDLFGRYKLENKLVYKEKTMDTPVVNEYASLLKVSLDSLGFNYSIQRRPPGLLTTHDVDVPYESCFINLIIRKISRLLGIDLERPILSKGFSMIFKTERECGIRSEWYFIVGGHDADYGDIYNVNSPLIQKLINSIRLNGDSVGWHYSFSAASDSDQMKKEAELYDQVIGGKRFGRNHFLRCFIPDSWNEYANNDILYDSTMGSVFCEGFAYGICTPYKLFDIVRGEELPVWEIPLIVMDSTLLEYRNLNPDEIIRSISNLTDAIIKHSGVFTVLIHNSYMRYSKKWASLYQTIMRYLSNRMKSMTGQKIIEYYK